MLLASKVMKNGKSVSRGWSTFGQFETLVTDIERYVFGAQPVLTPSQRQELWDKRTRCHPPQDADDGQRDWYKKNDWRSCGTLQKEGASNRRSKERTLVVAAPPFLLHFGGLEGSFARTASPKA